MTLLCYSHFPYVEWIWKFPHTLGKDKNEAENPRGNLPWNVPVEGKVAYHLRATGKATQRTEEQRSESNLEGCTKPEKIKVELRKEEWWLTITRRQTTRSISRGLEQQMSQGSLGRKHSKHITEDIAAPILELDHPNKGNSPTFPPPTPSARRAAHCPIQPQLGRKGKLEDGLHGELKWNWLNVPEYELNPTKQTI